MARRVLHAACSDTFAGVQRVILTVCSNLDRTRYEPLVATPSIPPLVQALAAENIPHFPIPFSGMTDFDSALALRRLMKKERVDVLHLHLGITTVLGSLAALGLGVPVVVSRHFIHENYTRLTGPRRVLATGVYGWLNHRARAVVAVSQAVAEGVLSREAGLGEKLTVIHNAVAAPPPFSPRPPPPPLRVVCLSRLDPEKGLDTFLEALALARQNGLDLEAHLLGKGQEENRLRQKAADLGLSGVLEIHGFVADTAPFLSAAHVLVHTAPEEPFGLALLEAMAQGLAVIAPGSGGPKEIVVHGETGLLLPPGDAPALAGALCELAGEGDRLQRFGEAGRQRVAEHFSAQAQAAAHMALYDRVLGG